MANNFRKLTKALVLTCAFSSIVVAQEPSSDKPPTASDNSKLNQQDRNPDRVTADQQKKEDTSDLSITREIRRELIDDKSLSAYAHNVKIITQSGTVTLKRPVRTDEEKRIVEAKAASVSGKAIKSELSVVLKK